MSKRRDCLEEAIHLAEQLKHILDKELDYEYDVTDEVQNIIDALEYDLDEEVMNRGR